MSENNLISSKGGAVSKSFETPASMDVYENGPRMTPKQAAQHPRDVEDVAVLSDDELLIPLDIYDTSLEN